jgi:hypothetical protein
MAAFRHLLRRWGYVKLSRYGLVLTADDRILSTRPTALDDGAGGRIVGWQDADLAMAELQPWEPRPDPGLRSPAQPVAQASRHAQTPALRASGEAMPVAVAPESAVDEDDWEWMIALARARVEAEVADVAPPRGGTLPLPTVAPPEPATSDWRKTEPVNAVELHEEPTAVRPVAVSKASAVAPAAPMPTATPMAKSAPMPAAASTGRTAHTAPMPAAASTARSAPNPRATAPATVIPVPTLPSIHDAMGVGRFEPVVRGAQVPPASSNRFAKGTAPIDPDTEPHAAMSDDTDPGFDHTRPGIGLPSAAQTVALPSIKRGPSPRR